MQSNDAIEESIGDEGGGVGVTQGNEMHILGEAVDHCENDGFAADLGQPLNEVHGDINPHLRRYFEGLQQAGGL